MALSADDRFNLELLRLLLHLAWADGAVAPQEVDMIFGLGRSWLVPEPELGRLHAALAAGEHPAEPDYALLRTRAEEALEAASALVLTDGKVHPAEAALLARVRTALGA
jgi:hypothetical protein